MASSKDKWVRRFFIAEIGRHKDGFTIYKVTSLIFLKKSPQTASKVSVWKRYNDFKKLYKSLDAIKKQSSINEPFPPFAKPKFFGRFEKEVVNDRRECAIKFLEFIAKHRVLYESDVFVKFFESSLNLDGGLYDCAQTVASCDASSDDDCNDDSGNVSNSKNCNDYQRTTDILLKSKSTQNTVSERHINNKYKIISECEKNRNILLNFNAETSENNIDKDDEACDKQMDDTVQPNITPLLKNDNSDYIIVAAAHMNAGYQHELLGEFEEAYIQYKFVISHLQLGVQLDSNPLRKTKVLRKIKKYIDRADRFYKKHLLCNISSLCKPSRELENYKVIQIVDSVMIVRDIRHLDVKRVIKTIEKCANDTKNISQYILHEKVPYMVNLHAYIETDSSIFLIIEYVSGGLLWKFIKSHYGINNVKSDDSCNHDFTSTTYNNLFESVNNSARLNAMDNNEIFNIENTSVEKKFNDESNCDLNITTNQLMEQSQELLKSVSETLKKSNSMINKDENLIYKSSEANDIMKMNNFQCMKSDEEPEFLLHECSSNLSPSRSINIPYVSNSCNLSNNTPIFRDITNTNEAHMKMTTVLLNNCAPLKTTDNNIPTDRRNWQIQESIVKQWAAQLILALETLHEQNVIVSNLRPNDLLIDQNRYIALSYVIPREFNAFTNLQIPYAAPELFLYLPHMSITAAVDIWSFGVILYELLTGIPFLVRHPGPFNCNSIISFPPDLHANAEYLLTHVLKFEPSERLTLHQIKNNAFFENIDWERLDS